MVPETEKIAMISGKETGGMGDAGVELSDKTEAAHNSGGFPSLSQKKPEAQCGNDICELIGPDRDTAGQEAQVRHKRS